jgi:threonine synthase
VLFPCPIASIFDNIATCAPNCHLVCTQTGDTGPAAVHAVSEAANPLLTIIVHYPHGQISEFQRKQLTTVNSKYVKVAAFEGGGDDMDWPIKETLLMNGDNDGSTGGRTFCGINSYNIGRPLLQMVHFVSLYCSEVSACK